MKNKSAKIRSSGAPSGNRSKQGGIVKGKEYVWNRPKIDTPRWMGKARRR